MLVGRTVGAEVDRVDPGMVGGAPPDFPAGAPFGDGDVGTAGRRDEVRGRVRPEVPARDVETGLRVDVEALVVTADQTYRDEGIGHLTELGVAVVVPDDAFGGPPEVLRVAVGAVLPHAAAVPVAVPVQGDGRIGGDDGRDLRVRAAIDDRQRDRGAHGEGRHQAEGGEAPHGTRRAPARTSATQDTICGNAKAGGRHRLAPHHWVLGVVRACAKSGTGDGTGAKQPRPAQSSKGSS